ncbi:MAG: PxKF domain-containing protein [Ornithinimicrobium sp.]|uniref:PxKF domain-containing protein n=1 Tax=Ornithinimicrobium sp. TaxID=1977084 RepID=UPI0026E04D5D|nr:PxKF domain-containing protein [Ornithinimicrobium sp.]MDO5739866.1 PxKF domain-containing protein [Ornithinimicrobium sp.]
MSQVTARKFTVSIAVLTLLLGVPAAGSALPKDPLDPPVIVDPGEEPPEPGPRTGFQWSMPSRFGGDADGDGIVDYHWDAATATYAQSYVNPDGFDLDLDGCHTAEEMASGTSLNNYSWSIDGEVVADRTHGCELSHRFPAEGDYQVMMTITTPEEDTTTVTETVTVKDWFIVSIGDSYGSGEGSPDVPQRFDDAGFVSAGARWVDQRCHRSANAGSAQAAIDIERSDRRSSVTFISLACSGATIDRTVHEGDAHMGSGILAPFRGTEPPQSGAYLKSQIQALAEAANGRTIDALIVSAGGNDAHFADIIADCVWHNMPRVLGTGGRCHEQPEILDRLEQDFATLPKRYDRLAAALADPAPAGRPALVIDNVYLTEYPDSLTDGAGQTCTSILGEITSVTPFDFAKAHIDRDEAEWARHSVVTPLNAAIEAAVARHQDKGWHFVSGISQRFYKHGYCAMDHFIVQAYESARSQGPLWPWIHRSGPMPTPNLMEQKGMMHPNRFGYGVYGSQIRAALESFSGSGPSFAVAPTALGLSSSSGAAGWLTGVCDGTDCASDRAVLTVSASDAAGLVGASLTVDGRDCADVTGVTCAADLGADGVYRWTLQIRSEGVRQLTFVASNRYGVTSTFHHDARVDLNDPPAPTAEVAVGLLGENDWYRSAVDVQFDGSDTPAGSGVALIEYSSPQLGDGTPYTVGAKAAARFGEDADGSAADGVYEINYRAVDQAGRRSAAQGLTLKIDQTAPTVVVGTPDERQYQLRESVTSGYDCADATSGVHECVGSVLDGAPLDTAAIGSQEVTVVATDKAGNLTSASVTYDVTYGLTALYDETKAAKAGSTVPIKLRLTDALGSNVSDPSLTLNAVRLRKIDDTVGSAAAVASSANPDSNFRYAGDSYIYNLRTNGLSPGTWALHFTVSGDPVEHTATFRVR